MAVVTVRELRNRGGDVLDRVAKGESIVVIRDGAPVAELRPLPRRSHSTERLIARRTHLPLIDTDHLRADIDGLIDSSM